MAEQVKKKPVDPNSAKYKLGKIAADAYVDAMEAKKRGEKVAWVSSNFPVEIPETMGIATVYPENQAAGIAARGAGTRMCEEAESEGYSNDICAYARVSLAYAKLKSCPEQDVPMPDVLLCCSNICSCMIKWYENLARELNIPMILLDIPFNPDYEVSDAEVAYVTGQFWDAVKQLEEITGKKWSDERFKEVTGYTLHQYISQKRLVWAGELIRSGMPVMKAAEQAGFSEYSTFLRAFRGTFHMSPREFR